MSQACKIKLDTMKKLALKFYNILKDAKFSSVQFFLFLTKPRSKNEDIKRKEFILNILLLSIIFLLSAMLLVKFYGIIFLEYSSKSLSPIIIFIILTIFMSLYLLSKKGFYKISSIIFIIIYLLPVTYMLYGWGIDIPQGILMYALLIIMSGILVSTRFAFFATFFVSCVFFALGYFQIHSIISFDGYWRREEFEVRDIIVYIITFFIIAIVSWLSNREIEKSLRRARESEAELQKERDMLEIKVEERTKELRKTQMEKMQILLRFAEMGRLSSGLFHDLVNPMTAVSLNLQQVKGEDKKELANAKTYLNQAIKAMKRMEELVTVVRQQLKNQEALTDFSINKEIKQVIKILAYKARKNEVEIIFTGEKEIKTYGSQIKFSQAATNFISNAIDSYCGMEKKDKTVYVNLKEKNGKINLSIKDCGCGIAKENLDKIFEPFFTTKSGGIGLGLSSSKNTIEKNFNGDIKVESEPGKGTELIITFPIKNNGDEQIAS